MSECPFLLFKLNKEYKKDVINFVSFSSVTPAFLQLLCTLFWNRFLKESEISIPQTEKANLRL